jgi:aspartate racemase
MTRSVLGVLGGMGPLASAEFVKTVYELSAGASEQEAPTVVLVSDPTFPDRTEALRSGDEAVLADRLTRGLHALERHGASAMVVCCVTIHRVLGAVPAALRRRVISLVDEVVDGLAERDGRHVMLCSQGTWDTEVFPRHPGWASVRDRVVFLDRPDQAYLHDEVIYAIKRNADAGRFVTPLERLCARYGARSFIAGCTELHLVVKRMPGWAAAGGETGILDPLSRIARRWSAQTLVTRAGG